MVALICRTAEMLPSRASARASRGPDQRTMDRPQPGGYVAPGILGVRRHQVEDGPNFLCLAADHTHP